MRLSSPLLIAEAGNKRCSVRDRHSVSEPCARPLLDFASLLPGRSSRQLLVVRAPGAAPDWGEEAMCPQVGLGREDEPGFSAAPGLLSALEVLVGDRLGIHPTRLLAVSFPSMLLAHVVYLGTVFPRL